MCCAWPVGRAESGENRVGSSEQKLLKRAIAGDERALEELFERNFAAVRQTLEGKIPHQYRSVLSVDDVMQETCVSAFLGIGRFSARRDGAFQAWLSTIALHKLQDALKALSAAKRGKGFRRIEPAGKGDRLAALWARLYFCNVGPSVQAIRREAGERLQRAVRNLPEKYRRVIELYDLDGWRMDDVASALRCTLGAAFMRRDRALDLLRDAIGTGLYEPGE